jgi:hypothetical protein
MPSGCIAAGVRQARDEAGTDRINGLHEHDRYRSGDPLQFRYASAGGGQNDVRRERDQFRRVLGRGVGTRASPAVVDPPVAAGRPARFLQSLCEGGNASVSLRIVRSLGHEHADAAHALRLLRARP